MKKMLKRIIRRVLSSADLAVIPATELKSLVARPALLPPAGDTGFRAVYCGSGRILAYHPTAGFMYLYGDDLSVTPGVVCGCYEPHVRSALHRLVKPGFVVLEGGANQGFHTLTMARLVGPEGRIVTFEPDPRNFEILGVNLRALYLTDIVIPHRKAMHSSNATLRFCCASSGGHSHVALAPDLALPSLREGTSPLPEGVRAEIEVEAVRAGDVLKEMGLKPDLIRLDIEGSEYHALQGVWEYLRHPSDVMVMFEYNPAALNGSADAGASELLTSLEGVGMSFHLITPDGSLAKKTLEEIAKTRDGELIDVVATRALL